MALNETSNKSPDCVSWLKERNLRVLPLTQQTLELALEIKHLLGIEEKYHPKGVDENDLFIISTAKINSTVLITEENRQPNLPNIDIRTKYKIPAVCNLQEVQVRNINFRNY